MSSRGPSPISRRGLLAGLVLAPAGALCVNSPAPVQAMDLARATVLVMIEDRGCPFCARFDAEARDSYVNSREGLMAPLVRYRRGDPAIAFLERVVYSPTFVLLVDGREIGRAVGYQGAELFWMEIARLMAKAGLPSAG